MFHNMKKAKDGKNYTCAECVNRLTREAPNRKETCAAWNKKREGYHKQYYVDNKIMWLNRGRENYLIRNFGITQEQYDAMELAQNHKCAICGKEETSKDSRQVLREIRRLAIDHDHNTGKIRGLLCRRCNTVLGQLEDDPSLFRAAADYLDKSVGQYR